MPEGEAKSTENIQTALLQIYSGLKNDWNAQVNSQKEPL